MYLNDPYFMIGENQEGTGNSPKKNIEMQKKKEFFQRKANMLSMLAIEESPTTAT